MKARLCRLILATCGIVDGLMTLLTLGTFSPSLANKAMWRLLDTAWFWR